jgi:hypothetical protein
MKTLAAAAAAVTVLAVFAAAPAHAVLKYNPEKGETSSETKAPKKEKSFSRKRSRRGPEVREAQRPFFGSTDLRGNVQQTTIVRLNTNVATGRGSLARTTIGAIRDVTIRGNVKQTTVVGRNTNVATGRDATAVTTIGAIQNAEIRGKVEQTTIVATNTNVASGRGATACSLIGTIGDDPNC